MIGTHAPVSRRALASPFEFGDEIERAAAFSPYMGMPGHAGRRRTADAQTETAQSEE